MGIPIPGKDSLYIESGPSSLHLHGWCSVTCQWSMLPDSYCWGYYPGPWFNIKMLSYRYRKSHYGDKTVVRSSYLHNGISYTGKMTSSYWIRGLVSCHVHVVQFPQLVWRWGTRKFCPEKTPNLGSVIFITHIQKVGHNPCHTEFILGNINIYLHFLQLFLNTEIVEQVGIPLCGRQRPVHYTPRNEVERAYTGFTLSVCPSVGRIMSALYHQQYLLDPFHICTSYQATSEGVSRVKYVSKLKKLKILANSWNLTLTWDPMWLNSMVIMSGGGGGGGGYPLILRTQTFLLF